MAVLGCAWGSSWAECLHENLCLISRMRSSVFEAWVGGLEISDPREKTYVPDVAAEWDALVIVVDQKIVRSLSKTSVQAVPQLEVSR